MKRQSNDYKQLHNNYNEMQKHHKEMKLQGSSQKREKAASWTCNMKTKCHMITEICDRKTRRLEETTNRLLMTIKR